MRELLHNLGIAPSGRKLEGPDNRKGHVGTIDGLLPATDEAVKIARRYWLELEEKEIERQGKIWIARGESYRLAENNPFMAADPAESSVSAFAVIDGRLLLLRRRGDVGHVESRPIGSVGGYSVPASDKTREAEELKIW